jgi:transposase
MKINKWQFRKISDLFPTPRGNVRLDNLTVLNAILYIAENGCKWRALPTHFGKWDTIYARMSRWAKTGILDRVFERLQRKNVLQIQIKAVSLDSTSIKVHPDGTGALKRGGRSPSENPEEDGTPSFIWLPRMPKAQ